MNIETLYYVQYLITVPDILTDGQNVHRLAFEHQKDCLYMAHTLKQELDPISRKQQCQELTAYDFVVKVPLPKPEGML